MTCYTKLMPVFLGAYLVVAVTAWASPRNDAATMSQINIQNEAMIAQELLDSKMMDALNIEMQAQCSNLDGVRTLLFTQAIEHGGNEIRIITDSRIDWHPDSQFAFTGSDTDNAYLFVTSSLIHGKAVVIQYDGMIGIINALDKNGNTITNLQFAPLHMTPPTDKAQVHTMVELAREITQRFVTMVTARTETYTTSPIMNIRSGPNKCDARIRVSMLTGRLNNEWIENIRI
eukprot:850878_1